VSLAVCAADALAVFLCGVASFGIAAEAGAGADLLTCFVIAAAPLAAVGCLHGRKLYSRAVVVCQVPLLGVALGWLQAFGLLLVAATAGVTVRHWGRHDLGFSHIPSRLGQAWTVTFLVSGLVALVGVRVGWASVRRGLLRGDVVHNRAVVVGAGTLAEAVVARLRADGGSGFEVVGVLDEGTGGSWSLAGLPLLGTVRALPAVVEREQVDTVVIALSWASAARIDEAIRVASMCPVDIRLAIEPTAAGFLDRPLARVAGVPLLNVDDIPISGRAAVLKRAEDIVLAALALVALAPALALIAVAIKLDTPGPILFRQPRRGFGNRVFDVYKFRSMHADMGDIESARQTSKGDLRVTRVGAFLRAHSFDELPQLINVLRGDMSIVGPRPHALRTTAAGVVLEDALQTYAARHRVKPGITGWAQVNGWRGELDTQEKLTRRVECDLWYIKNWSLLLDLKILARTLLCVVFDTNAY
jgi:Undecaprenyl-phosphate glucose phosphotransferase